MIYSSRPIYSSSGVARNFNWGSSPFSQFVPPLPFTLPLPSPPLEVGSPKIQLGGLGEHCELPSGVWGGAAAEIEFGAFWLLKMRPGGNDFNYFKLTKLMMMMMDELTLAWR